MAGRLLGAFEEYLASGEDAPPGRPDDILRGLVCLQPSRRLALAAGTWHPSADEADALAPLVSCARAWGRPVDASALTALAAWCEVEGQQSTLVPFKPSMYTVQVLLTALRLPFLAVRLDVPQQAAAMLALSPGGLLAQASDELAFYDDPSAAAPPAGAEILIRVPTLTRLSAPDVRLFLALGGEVMACYQADLDKRRRWLRLTAGGDVPERFVDGIRTWHFRGQVLGELRLAPPEARTWVAVWQDNRGSLHFLPPDQAPPEPMTRTRQVPWLPCLEGAPDGFDEVRAQHTAQWPEAARLDRLHAAVRTLVEGPPAAFVALDEADTADLRQRLQSSPLIGRAFARAIEASTSERLITYVGGDHAVEVLEPLHAALDLPGMRDFAAMALMYELCLSEETNSRGFVKSCKPDLMRAALRHQLLEQIQEGDDATRGAACRLLATGPCMAAARERAVVEYELKLHLDDPVPGVAEQATLALAASTLRDLVPLCGLFRIERVAAHQDTAGSAERRGRVQALAREIAAVQKRLGGLPRHSRESSGTAEALASVVLDVREAMTAAPAPQGRVVLFSPPLLDEVIERVRRHLEAYAWELDLSLDELYEKMVEAGIARWITFVARAELEAGRTSLDEDEERDVESFAWSKACAPLPFWVENAGHINPLFSALLRRSAEDGLSGVGIAVLPLGSRTVTRLPAMLYMRVFDAARHAFVSLVDLMRARTTDMEREIWGLVAAAMPQDGDDDEADSQTDEEAPKPVDVRPPGPPAPLDLQEAPQRQVERAERLCEAFQLPSERLLQVVYVLHDCGVDAPAAEAPVEVAPTAQPALAAPPPLRQTSARS